MAPITERHQTVHSFLLMLVHSFVRRKKLGRVLHDPYQMQVSPDGTRAPDILYVATERLHLIERTRLRGPADLVVEIISPGSRTIDRGEKFYEYEAAGVREFWLIDPDRQQVEWYLLGEDKLFHAQNLTDGVFHSRELEGVWIEEAWLWQDEMPDEIEILKLWGVI